MFRSLFAGALTTTAAALFLGVTSAAAAVAPAPPPPLRQVQQALGQIPQITEPGGAHGPMTKPASTQQGGSATGAAVRIQPLLTCIACSQADASPGNPTASATAIRLLGQNVSAGNEYGSKGFREGNLFAVPQNPSFSLAVGSWAAGTQTTTGGFITSADASSSLVSLFVPNTLNLEAVRSDSHAMSDSAGHKQADSSSDALYLGGAGQPSPTTIVLLHSDASSAGPGHVWLIGVNGTGIGEMLGQSGIPIDLHPLLLLMLVHASAVGSGGHSEIGTLQDAGGSIGEDVTLFNSAQVD
jgi:hypothetical protein